MKKAIWKIDYSNQLITIANSIEAIAIPETAEKAKFSTEITGTPTINMNLNGLTVKNVTIDSGSSGGFKLSTKEFYNLKNTTPSMRKSVSYGSSTFGLFGAAEPDSIYRAIVNDISFGDLFLKNTIIRFKGESGYRIGNKFFKNYDLVLNWFANEIYFIKKLDYNNAALNSFGFNYIANENSFFVSEIYQNSSASLKGLKLGDELLKIGDVTCRNLSTEQVCKIMEKKLLGTKEQEISITILRDNEELNFLLEKKKLL